MTITTPEVRQQDTGEQLALDALRRQLVLQGEYTEDKSPKEMFEIFRGQIDYTKVFVEESRELDESTVSVDDAVDVLLEVGQPIVELTVDSKYRSDVDETDLTDEEKDEKRQQIYELFRKTVTEQVTPEDVDEDDHEQEQVAEDQTVYEDDVDEAEDSENGESIWKRAVNGAVSLKDRISLSYKKTRNAYKHYALISRELEKADPNSEERKALVRQKREAKGELKSRVAKSFGVTALVAGGVEAMFVSKGIDTSTIMTGAVVGAVAPAAAIDYERRSMKESAHNASLGVQIRAMSFLSSIGQKMGSAKSAMSEKHLNLRELDQQNPDAYNELNELDEEIREYRERMHEMQNDESVDLSGNQTYQELVSDLAEAKAEKAQLFAELTEQYGAEKLTRKAKIGIAIGAVAATGAAIYLAKNGLPFTGGKGGNAAEQVPTGGSGNREQAGEAASTTVPSTGGRGGATLGEVNGVEVPSIAPEGVDQDAYNQLSLGEKANFIDAYSDFSGAEKEAFNQFVEGVEVIQEAHPQATPEQIDTLVTNTLEFSAMKEEYVSAGDNWLQQAARAQWFDEQARRFFEATKDLEELTS